MPAMNKQLVYIGRSASRFRFPIPLDSIQWDLSGLLSPHIRSKEVSARNMVRIGIGAPTISTHHKTIHCYEDCYEDCYGNDIGPNDALNFDVSRCNCLACLVRYWSK